MPEMNHPESGRFLGQAPLDDRGKLLTPPIDRVQDELRQPRVTWHFNLFTNQNIDTAPEDDLGFNLGSHQASDLFEQEAGCRRIAGPETIERPDRVLVTLTGARMILGQVERATYSISRGWKEPGEKNLLAALK